MTGKEARENLKKHDVKSHMKEFCPKCGPSVGYHESSSKWKEQANELAKELKRISDYAEMVMAGTHEHDNICKIFRDKANFQLSSYQEFLKKEQED